MIDHSVQVDEFASRLAFARNVELEVERNRERYAFLRWGQASLRDFKVVPPGTGIVHQVNLEYLARVVESRDGVAFPDTVVGLDSHTTMVNGLGVLGWGVGGIEAEAALLGEPLSMLVPQVVGFRLQRSAARGQRPRPTSCSRWSSCCASTGVVGKFVEYFGDGVSGLTVADRATLGNMSPEYGATCGFFPVDELTLDYLRLTGRAESRVALVEAYCRENLLWHEPDAHPEYSQVVELDLDEVEPSIAGPRRPQDRVPLARAKQSFLEALADLRGRARRGRARSPRRSRRATRRPSRRRAGTRSPSTSTRRSRSRPSRGRAGPGLDRRRGARARPRRGRDRGDHLVHEHLEPAGDGRGRACSRRRRSSSGSGARRG